MAECRPKNYPKLKNYKPSRFMLPTCHYDAAKADRAVTFIENLRHTKGKWAGKRFWLLPWQEQIIRDVFGIVDEKGNRQFRTAYVEIGKKNGKSELAAAVALYLLFADNEPSAEVYGAAADRQQASIVFDVAHQMVQMTPALLKRCKIMAATKRIVNYGNAGFYARIANLMSNETWMNAKKAVELGFADEILFEKKEEEPDSDPADPENPEEDPDSEPGEGEEKKPFQKDTAGHLFSSRQMDLIVLNRLGVKPEQTEPKAKEPEKTPPTEPPANPGPVLDMDGKTEDGSIPYNILMKQLECMK